MLPAHTAPGSLNEQCYQDTPYARFASLALCSWAFKAAFFSFTLGERDLDILLASRIRAWCTLSEP